MKNCPKCNAELNDDVVFCTECGEALEVVEAAPKAEVVTETPKQSKVSLILGIVSLVLCFFPIVPGVYPITAIIGTVFGVKETKEGGNKIGLILNIVALAIFAGTFILGIISAILYLLFVAGVGLGGLGIFFELFEEILWELGLY